MKSGKVIKALKRSTSVRTCNMINKSKKGSLGQMINNYQILKKLGEGCFASVYLCKDVVSANLFALKKMKVDYLKK